MEHIIPLPLGYHEEIEPPRTARNTEALWSFCAETSGESVVLPDGRSDLIIRIDAARPDKVKPIVTGPATKAFTVSFEKGDIWYGIRLRPERAKLLWGREISDAQDGALTEDKAFARVPKLAEFCVNGNPFEQLKRAIPAAKTSEFPKRLSNAVDTIHATGGRIRVERLASFVSCSSRHLNRLFRANIGLSVKTYIQLAQFHRTLRLVHVAGIPITDAAFEGGYADHAHLTRSFQRFGGFAPTSIPSQLTLPVVFHV